MKPAQNTIDIHTLFNVTIRNKEKTTVAWIIAKTTVQLGIPLINGPLSIISLAIGSKAQIAYWHLHFSELSTFHYLELSCQ
jgi:hypothetical protein